MDKDEYIEFLQDQLLKLQDELEQHNIDWLITGRNFFILKYLALLGWLFLFAFLANSLVF